MPFSHFFFSSSFLFIPKFLILKFSLYLFLSTDCFCWIEVVFDILIMSYFVSRLTMGFRLCLLFECDHDRELIPMDLSGWDGQEDLNIASPDRYLLWGF